MKALIHFWLFLAFALLPAQGQGILSLAGSPPAAGGGGASVTDNFDSYANGTQLELQPNWAAVNGSINIVKPAADGKYSGGVQVMARYTGTAFSANHRSEITLDTSGGAFEFICAGVRCQSGADTRYWLQSDGDNWYLVHRVAGTQSVLASGTHATLTAGDKIGVEVTGAGSATRLTGQIYRIGAWSNITGAVSMDPGAGKYIDGGAPGCGGDGTAARGDDFAAFDL